MLGRGVCVWFVVFFILFFYSFFFFLSYKMLVTYGNFQSISVCSLMFKLNFTSFVIVTPAALVIVKCMSVHRTHFSEIYNFTVKVLFCAETWHAGFLTRNKLFF